MNQKIGLFNVLLLEGTLDKDNLEAMIKKAMDLFEGNEGLMQCCSLEFVPSKNFALHAVESALTKKPLGSTNLKKKSLTLLLWLYCTTQLDKALELAGKTEKGVILVIAAKNRALTSKALEAARELGFKEEKGLIEKNLEENLDSFVEHFHISKNELRAFSHLPKEKAVELLAIERQALLSL